MSYLKFAFISKYPVYLSDLYDDAVPETWGELNFVEGKS